MTYPIAPNGIYRSIQGEGALCGVPTVFVRLAGCSVGCPLCDTDYRVDRKLSAGAVAAEALSLTRPGDWCWVTGGEPTDHDLGPLLDALLAARLCPALATSGVRRVRERWAFLSVSPHDPGRWEQRSGDQLNLVPGLNGFGLDDFAGMFTKEDEASFTYRYVTPCDGRLESLAECRAWVESRRGWRLGWQMHKHWGVD